METTVVKLSRPLLIKTDIDSYQIIYGFALKGDSQYKLQDIEDYIGYLAGLHIVSNGGNDFAISFERRGHPDWVDKKGYIHISHDAWIKKTGRKCVQKLNLSYSILVLDMDEEDYHYFVNEDDLIVSRHLYNKLKEGMD